MACATVALALIAPLNRTLQTEIIAAGTAIPAAVVKLRRIAAPVAF
jgi:hypothetical protein